MTKHNLKKNLNGLDVFCISAGAMISSGIFVLPGVAFQNIGPAVFLAYMVAGILAFVFMHCTSESAVFIKSLNSCVLFLLSCNLRGFLLVQGFFCFY